MKLLRLLKNACGFVFTAIAPVFTKVGEKLGNWIRYNADIGISKKARAEIGGSNFVLFVMVPLILQKQG